jgi:cold shock CspA family protein
MKNLPLLTVVNLTLGIAALSSVPASLAEEKPAAPVHTCSGTVSSVDADGRAITLKKFWLGRTLNLAAECEIQTGARTDAALSDVRPGMIVVVQYTKQDGVMIADSIRQKLDTTTGSITALDRQGRNLKLRGRPLQKEFRVAQTCGFTFAEDAAGRWKDLEPGQRVTVTYAREDGKFVAHHILEPGKMFIGTLDALDANARSIKVRQLFGTKRFNLARDCRIVIGPDVDKRMHDLRLGQKVLVDYQETDGVMIATRIMPVEPTTAATASEGPEVVQSRR